MMVGGSHRHGQEGEAGQGVGCFGFGWRRVKPTFPRQNGTIFINYCPFQLTIFNLY